MSKRIFYTGVGSRETPQDMIRLIEDFAELAADRGFTLRSGGASGADSAFERGCDRAEGRKEIYLPYRNFNGNRSTRYNVTDTAFELASKVHPVWDHLSVSAKRLHARNAQQVFGPLSGLENAPSRFLVCWTPDGAESESARTRSTGGTATAIVLAARAGIPVFNLARPGRVEQLNSYVIRLLAVNG